MPLNYNNIASERRSQMVPFVHVLDAPSAAVVQQTEDRSDKDGSSSFNPFPDVQLNLLGSTAYDVTMGHHLNFR